jgi:hypothetical protein
MTDYLDLKPGPFQESTIDGGLAKLVRIWEYLRELNEYGYGSGRLVTMKNGPAKTDNKKTDCSPFTATAIYMALDPRPVDLSKPYPLREPYDPRYDGGKPLTNLFFDLHNSFGTVEYKTKSGGWKPRFKQDYVDKIPNLFTDWKWINDSAGSVVIHNLGVPVDDKQMRRGDLVGINWMSGGGHAAFCWNVHLNKDGEVDCIQYVTSNGSGQSGLGVTVCQYPQADKRYLTFDGSKYVKVEGKDMFAHIIDDPKAYPEYAASPYHWYALRHIKKEDIDRTSFGVPKEQVAIVDYTATWKNKKGEIIKLGIDKVMVARLNGVTPPEPWLKAGDKTAPAEPAKPKPVTTVKSKPVEAMPSSAPTVQGAQTEKKAEEKKTEPAKQDPAKPPPKEQPKAAAQGEVQPHQVEVELQLQQLWIARWIGVDPGNSTDVNDAKSQAAIQDFQSKYMKDQKVPHPGHADPATRKRMASFAAWALSMPNVNLALHALHEHGELEHAPGEDPAQLDDKSLAAVKEFQTKKKLDVDGVPGPQTQKALAAALKGLGDNKADPAPAPSQQKAESAPEKKPESAPTKTPGKKEEPPALWDVYFTRNFGKAGDKATVAVVAFHCEKKKFAVGLFQDDKPLLEKAGEVEIKKGKGRLEVQIPSSLAPGALLEARVAGEGLSAKTAVPFEVETAEAATESADWRPYVGKDEVPAGVLEAVRKNRAKYPAKELPPVTGDKYKGVHHYNYDPPDDHASWAKDYFQKKFDAATAEKKHAIRAYLEMLVHEGRPASMQTYDNQIVTWGVGTGAMGNGKEVFQNLNEDAKMKKLLDDVGINFFDGDYHVVDLAKKKVVSSPPGKKTKQDPSGKGEDSRHRLPLDSWRQQPDLLSAIIGISEDKATREAVADAQFDVYMSGAGSWPGQDKIFTQALFFMITHMRAWYPDFAKNGFDINKEFAKIGGKPSLETDKKLAPIFANGFVRRGKAYFGTNKVSYDDLRLRTKTKVWEALKEDGKKEAFNPGELVYEKDL